ncbi:SDR family NAD(P)-dependent oxidoreductase [Haloarcula marina]|uniref:SDR family NAD(P)-dependent oxidoreductase n=1 Tax=Haloarcula marina TaxID=2961574 RepID=UPI0020B807ED|nr:SDR family NAD(P)-dependent oxidoreductase [Halomicroarcula marina]
MEVSLADSVALVTGSSRNIGREIAVRMAEAGADVGVTARSDADGCERTAELVRAAGGNATVALGDLSDPADIERIVESVATDLGPIDRLVNNASYRPTRPFLDVTVEEWQHVHDVDLRAMALLSQEVIPDMIAAGGGAIVNVVGSSIYTGITEKTHVMANKAGIPGLTRGLALEFGGDGLRANAVCFGLIDTDRDLDNYEGWERYSENVRRSGALGRLGTPGECADAVCYLASERSSYITGQVIHVNGGTFPITDLSAV